MQKKDVTFNSNTMTPYTGSGLVFNTKAVTIINGNRYLLKSRQCNICVHSNLVSDRSPLVCRINLCSLYFNEDIKKIIDNSIRYTETVNSRFFFFQYSMLNRTEINENDFNVLIEDKRIIDIKDRCNCYYLTNCGGLYRICDLMYIFENQDKCNDIIERKFIERDNIIEYYLIKRKRNLTTAST